MNIEDIRKLYASGDLTSCEVIFVPTTQKWMLQFFRESTNEWISLTALKSKAAREFHRDRLTTPMEIARAVGYTEVPVKIDHLPASPQIRSNPIGNIHRFSSKKTTEGKTMNLL